MTARELLSRYQGYLIERWNHTSMISHLLHNIQASIITIGSHGKSKPSMKSFAECHPFLDHKNKDVINNKNFGKLRAIAEMVAEANRK